MVYLDDSLSSTVRYYVVKQQLTQQILNSKEKGTAQKEELDTKLIVSLTTHGARIHTVPFAIESIFSQTLKPDKVVLYLNKNEFSIKTLPLSLMRQAERGLDLRFVNDLGPHTKLVPALQEFPESIIITVDDDYMYPFDLIERLYSAHLSHPEAVCCSHSRIIKCKQEQALAPYDSFEMCFPDKDYQSNTLLAEGFGGVLYPPHSLSDEVFNLHNLKRLSPYADDVWFKGMELLANTPVVQIARNRSWFHSITSEITTQDIGLKHYNLGKCGNDVQLNNLFSHYDLYGRLK